MEMYVQKYDFIPEGRGDGGGGAEVTKAFQA